MLIEWTRKLWFKGMHNAFTDLVEFNNRLFCCFREASSHVSCDGKIRVLEIDRDANIVNSYLLQENFADLRDPKLTVTPDAKLLLNAYARYHNTDAKWQYSRPCCWVSQDGTSWSGKRHFGDKNWWLWRIRWHQQRAFGFAYNKRHNALNFYQGDPRRTFDKWQSNALSLAQHGVGYPNESDLLFSENGDAYALVRRDADSYSAQLGYAKPPYKKWHWYDLIYHIGAPVMSLIDSDKALVVGRIFKAGKAKTAVLSLCLISKKVTLLEVLPSSGDTSYAGLVIEGSSVYVSYYSSHIDNKSNIYLTKITL